MHKPKHLIAILFVITMVAFAITLWHDQVKQHNASLRACERGNDLRRDINDNNRDVIKFLNNRGTQLQTLAYRSSGPVRASEIAQAKSYFDLAAKARILPIINCERAFG